MRARPIPERAPLRRSSPAEAWRASFNAYLDEVGCPLAVRSGICDGSSVDSDPARVRPALRWLASHAVALAYEERAGEVNASAEAALATSEVGAPPERSVPTAASGLTADVTSATAAADAAPADGEVLALVRDFAAALYVHVDPKDDALRTLQAAHRALRLRVLPALVSAGTDKGGGKSGAAAPKRGGSLAAAQQDTGPLPHDAASNSASLEGFPPGLSTGDADLDKAIAVLRMLFVADLRELQNSVNEILAMLQNFTANPRTDSSLGAVGR